MTVGLRSPWAPDPTPAWRFVLLNWLFWIGALLALAVVYRWFCSLWPRLPGARSLLRISTPLLLLLLFAVAVAIAVLSPRYFYA